MKKEEKLMIERGNGVFYGLMAFFGVLTVFLAIYLNSHPDQGYGCLLILNILSLAIMIPYRFYILKDKEYMDYVYPNVKSPWVFELPFFPCNTAEMLLLVAVITRSRMLLSYCFFLGFVGPILAFIQPCKGFERGSLLNFRIFGFYSTHYFCLMNMPLMLVSHFYIPGYMDVVKMMLFYAVMSFAAYLFNRYLDSLELGYKANYFFNMDPDYHPIFRKIYNVLPHRYLFTVPLMILIGLVLEILVFIIQIIM